MGLDVYVGSLTRYYTRNWETVVQKYGREQGIPVQIMRLPGSVDPTESSVSTEEARAIVTAWRKQINTGLKEHLTAPLEWDESDQTPYFTDKPAWDGYCCLMLLAAYEEHPKLTKPREAVSQWAEDPAWQASTADDFQSSYSQLLRPEFWLPGEFDFTFVSTDPAGSEVRCGSSSKLLEQLWVLNQKTFRLDTTEIGDWRRAGVEANGPFEVAARFGLSMFIELTQESVKHHLPMRLDF